MMKLTESKFFKEFDCDGDIMFLQLNFPNYDKNGKDISFSNGISIHGSDIHRVSINFNNAFGDAKRHGATSILEIMYNDDEK